MTLTANLTKSNYRPIISNRNLPLNWDICKKHTEFQRQYKNSKTSQYIFVLILCWNGNFGGYVGLNKTLKIPPLSFDGHMAARKFEVTCVIHIFLLEASGSIYSLLGVMDISHFGAQDKSLWILFLNITFCLFVS